MKADLDGYDPIIKTLAAYTAEFKPTDRALSDARICLADAMGCAMQALNFDACRNFLGPWVDGTLVPNGCRIPGTEYILDPVLAALNFGAMIRWLDYNDTFLAMEWAHPSDNLGALLPLADHISQVRGKPINIRDLLTALIKAYEIQGILALKNSFNRIGIDHVILVKIATTAVATQMLGGDMKAIAAALSQAFIDYGPLRTYRHAPNTGQRKSWAAGDAASRGVELALITMRGEPGYATPLTAPRWGVQDVLFHGKALELAQPLGSYIVEHILFKIAFPAEFHAQTAVEAAIFLHEQVKNKIDEIERIDILTHDSAIRIIDKKGPLKNYADRDHCMQYMVAIGLIYGNLTAEHYHDQAALDPRIDTLREKMHLHEEPRYSKEYLDPEKRSIASALTITLKNGVKYGPHAIEYPLGHAKRRAEALPLLYDKLRTNLFTRFSKARSEEILQKFQSPALLDMSVPHFIDLFLQE